MVEGFQYTNYGVIPSDWSINSIQELLDNNSILSHLDGNHGELYPKSHEFVKFGVPYIAANDFANGEVNFDSCKFLCEDRASLFKKGIAKDGDVLFAHNATVGPVALLKTSLKYVILSTTATYFRCNSDKISNVFLKYVLKSPFFVKQYKAVMMQSTRAQVPITAQRKFSVFLPVPAEQTAIATALNDADALIQKLEQLIAKKRNIKTGAMQELLKPKEGWEVKKLGDLTKVFTKQTGFDYTEYIKPSLVTTRTDDTIPFIQNKDFNNKWINFKTDYYIPKSVALNFPKILLNEKSLLISISGSVGNVGVYDYSELAFIGGAVAILKFKNPTLIDWVWIYLKSERGQEKLFGNTKSSSHVNLILDDIRKIEIEFPKEEEQIKIAQFLADVDNEITELEKQLEKYKMMKQGMMQSLLTGKIRLV